MRRIGRVIALVVAGLAMAAATGWGALVLFYDYMRDINELRERPRFYNTLTTNCTTMILAHAAVNSGSLPYSWKVLLSGYAPEYAYDSGRLDRALPFEALQRRAHINAVAQAADQAPDFSRRIRTSLP